MYAYIPARDLARARAFYEQKVGLRPTQDETIAPAQQERGVEHHARQTGCAVAQIGRGSNHPRPDLGGNDVQSQPLMRLPWRRSR